MPEQRLPPPNPLPAPRTRDQGVVGTIGGFFVLGGANLRPAGVAGVGLNTAGGVAYSYFKWLEKGGEPASDVRDNGGGDGGGGRDEPQPPPARSGGGGGGGGGVERQEDEAAEEGVLLGSAAAAAAAARRRG
jgi:hypothetical protein